MALQTFLETVGSHLHAALEKLPYVQVLFFCQLALICAGLLLRLIYAVCVFVNGKRFNAAHRRVLISAFRTCFWYGLAFALLLWVVGNARIRLLLIDEFSLQALALFALALVGLLLSLLALLRRRDPERLLFSRNLLRSSNLNLALALMLSALVWLVG